MYHKPHAIDGPHGRRHIHGVDLFVTQESLDYTSGRPDPPKSWWRRFIKFIQGLFN